MSARRNDLPSALRALALALVLSASCGLGRQAAAPEQSPEASPSGANGFASGTVGGADGPLQWVTSLADSGRGTLRAAAERPGPARIRFRVAGTIELIEPIRVGSNKTIDGRGTDVTIANRGLEIAGVSNVVVSDLTFARLRGPASDGIQIRGGSRSIWVTHCEFTDGEDGAVDVTERATDVTVSWSHFHDFDKTMLINGEASPARPRVTLHHNLFQNTVQRNPRAVRAQVDAYNNYLRHWTGIGMQAAEESEINSEANVFEAGTDRDAIVSRGVRQGSVRSTRDVALNGARIMERDPDQVFRPPYQRSVQPAGAELTRQIEAGAGPRRQTP